MAGTSASISTWVYVRLDYDVRTLTLTVSDDGKGFSSAAVKDSGKTVHATEGRYGLTGMRERSTLIRGSIEIISEPGKGTTVVLSVPAPEARNKPAVPED